MSLRPSAVAALLDPLGREWDPAAANELARYIGEVLGTKSAIRVAAPGSIEFTCKLTQIRLRGMHEVPFLLVGRVSQAAAIVDEFLIKHIVPGRIPFVLALPDESVVAGANVGHGTRVLESSAGVRELLLSADPLSVVRQWALRCTPRRSLIPFNQELTPEDNMFFGRERELDRLYRQDQVSFAVAGPGRVGKTSLVKKYQRNLPSELSDTTIYIDLQECGHKNADALAAFIAFKVEQNRDAKRVDAADFFNFLRRMRGRKNRRIELILDEVDSVCQGNFFEMLGEAAKHGLVRLILCGRGRLLATMQDTDSHLFGRLDLLHPEPLNEISASALILQPLSHLNLSVEDPNGLTRRILSLTGRHPHLLQFYGRKLAELCIDEGSDTVTERHLATLHFDYEIAQLFTSPLDGLEPDTHAVAVSLLKARPTRITHSTILGTASSLGLPTDFDNIRSITRELFVNNVLAWSNLHYVLAYEALADYAHEMGLLETGVTTALSTDGAC